jgi:hypothetical protein
MTQAEIFHDFMRAVSEDDIKNEKGLPLHDKYHNARKVAETMGAKQVARVDDREQWLFPDGSTVEIPKMARGID